MSQVRTTITLDEDLAASARELGINVSRAARQGVADAVRAAMVEADRRAYIEHPEKVDAFWESTEAWSAE